MTSTHADPRSHEIQDPPVRLWLLLLSGPIGYLVGSTIGYDYGTAAGVIAACVYTTSIGAFAVFGSRCKTWLVEHRTGSAIVFGTIAFVTLVGLHVFTPAEDLVVAAAAGLAAAFIVES